MDISVVIFVMYYIWLLFDEGKIFWDELVFS